MSKRRRDPLHSPDRSVHAPPGRLPQSPVPVPRPLHTYQEDIGRFWYSRLEHGATNFATAISAILALPQLRAFWPMSSVDESENVYDISGQGRTLSPQTNPSFGTAGPAQLTPYLLLNGSHYMSRADEAGLDITGTLTIGGWFYRDVGGTTQGLISKWINGGDQRSYRLVLGSGNALTFTVCSDGTSATTTGIGSSSNTPEAAWFFGAGRYTPSTEVAVFLNTTKTTNLTSVPSSIFSGTGDFFLGAIGGAGSNLLDGRIALPFVSAAALTDQTLLELFHTTRTLFGV